MALGEKNLNASPFFLNSKKQTFAICLLLAGLILLVFGRAIYYPYVVLDDLYYVKKNQMVLAGFSARSLYWAFTTFHTGDWQPLTWLSWMLPAYFFGQSPVIDHSINIFLHIVTASLFFIALKKYSGSIWRSALAAALFAVHPMRVESVVWVAERKDVLAGLFWMWTMLAYYDYTKKPSLFKMLWTAFVMLLGLMAKPVLVSLPILFLLLDYWPLKRFNIGKVRLLFEKVPLIAVSLFSCVMACLAVRPYMMSFEQLSIQLRLINAFLVYTEYLKKTFWPYPLASYYPHPLGNYSMPMLWFSIFLLVTLTWIAFRYRSQRPAVFVGWLWFMAALFPMAGLIQVGRAAMADRYLYFPHMGLFMALVWLLPEIGSPNRRGIHWKNTWAAILIFPLMALGYVQTGYWRSSEVLDRHTLAVTGSNPIIESNLEYGVIEKKMETKDVEGLLTFLAKPYGVEVPSAQEAERVKK